MRLGVSVDEHASVQGLVDEAQEHSGMGSLTELTARRSEYYPWPTAHEPSTEDSRS